MTNEECAEVAKKLSPQEYNEFESISCKWKGNIVLRVKKTAVTRTEFTPES